MKNKSTSTLFEDLFRRYHRAVYSLFIRRGFTAEDARDLAQTTFFRVLRGMGAYRGDAEWQWIVEIANRVGLNQLRYHKAAKRNVDTTSLDELDYLPSLDRLGPSLGDSVASPLDDVLRRESTRRLKEAMAELPDQDRRFLLLWLQGFKYREIADLMKVTMDTVKSRLFRARRQLQARLGDLGIGLSDSTGDESERTK